MFERKVALQNQAPVTSEGSSFANDDVASVDIPKIVLNGRSISQHVAMQLFGLPLALE